MDVFFWCSSFIFLIVGIIIGSFLNCVIWRSYCGESAAKGRSYCPKCRHSLAWYDLVPVASFFVLRGKCRYCGKPISWQYPIVELATAFMFWATAVVLTPQILSGYFSILLLVKLLAYWFFFASLMVVLVADLKWYFIPDGAILTGIIAAAVYTFINAGGGYPWRFFDFDMVRAAVFSAIAAAAVFLAIFAASRGKWIGFGDVNSHSLWGWRADFPEYSSQCFSPIFLVLYWD